MGNPGQCSPQLKWLADLAKHPATLRLRYCSAFNPAGCIASECTASLLRVLAFSHAFMEQTSHVADCRDSMSRKEAEEVVTLPWPLPLLASPMEATLVLQNVCDKSSNISRGKCREGMSRKDAEELVKTALALAMSRDGSSGGLARLVTLSKAGAERKLIEHDDIPAFWDELEVLKTNGNASNMLVV